MHASVVRTAGRPAINTPVLPLGKTLTVGWCAFGGREQT